MPFVNQKSINLATSPGHSYSDLFSSTRSGGGVGHEEVSNQKADRRIDESGFVWTLATSPRHSSSDLFLFTRSGSGVGYEEVSNQKVDRRIDEPGGNLQAAYGDRSDLLHLCPSLVKRRIPVRDNEPFTW